MSEIDQIKQQVDIIDLARQFGANPSWNGKSKFANCKHNPLRSEKTCSLKLVPSTNSFSDFGNSGGSVIDFYSQATGKSIAESIKDLKNIANIEIEPRKQAPIPQQDYMSSQVVRKIFDKQIPLDFKNDEHKKLLDEYAPKWVFQSARTEDISFFVSSVRKAAHEDTTMILIRDEHGHETSLKYRFKTIGDNIVKWCGMEGTKSNFLYTRLTENPLTIITEGTSDFLVAVLLGYSVISIPSASYNGSIPLELTKDREVVFIGDDGDAGQRVIDRLYEETVCDKKRFIYSDFGLKGTDFKDMVLEVGNVDKFKTLLNDYVSGLKSENLTDWQSILKRKDKIVTRQKIEETENIRILIDGILPHGQITTLVGQPNVGKSAFSFAMINRLFFEKQIQNIIYYDADNPLVYTKERILKLMDKNGDDNIQYYTGSTASKMDMLDSLEMLTQFRDAGRETIIVIDSLKNFISGSINDDKSLNPMFDMLQQVRDVFGATIIVLHHTRKGKDEDGELNYVGSQVIEASSDNMTYLSRDEDKIVLKNKKARALLTPELCYTLDFEAMEFLESEMPTDKGEKTIELIIEAIGSDTISKKELKERLRGKVKAKNIDEILKDKKNTTFKWKKEDDDWLVSVAMQEPEPTKYKDAVYEAEFKVEAVEGLF